MPILHLRTDVAQLCARYSIVGTYASRPFVKHAALLPEDVSLLFGEENVPVFHIGPPLIAGPRTTAATEQGKQITVHLVGFVDLDADDLEGIKTWLKEVDKEDRPLGGTTLSELLPQYRVSPPIYPVPAENGTLLYRQFSCVGYVMDCYRYIDVNLIDDSDMSVFPEVSVDELAANYGVYVKRKSYREKIGLEGDGPWKVVLASYVFHSLNRDNETVSQTPYIPSGDASKAFPTPDLPPATAAPTPPNPA